MNALAIMEPTPLSWRNGDMHTGKLSVLLVANPTGSVHSEESQAALEILGRSLSTDPRIGFIGFSKLRGINAHIVRGVMEGRSSSGGLSYHPDNRRHLRNTYTTVICAGTDWEERMAEVLDRNPPMRELSPAAYVLLPHCGEDWGGINLSGLQKRMEAVHHLDPNNFQFYGSLEEILAAAASSQHQKK